jgi:hypothetical protein
MPRQDDYRENIAVKLPRRASTPADKTHWLALADSWLHPANQLDYMIRRWVIPRGARKRAHEGKSRTADWGRGPAASS